MRSGSMFALSCRNHLLLNYMNINTFALRWFRHVNIYQMKYSIFCFLLVLIWICLISIRFLETLFTYMESLCFHIQYLDTLISFTGFPSCWFFFLLNIYFSHRNCEKQCTKSSFYTDWFYYMFYVKTPF